MVQLLIIYFVVFGSVKIDKVLVAIMAFGLNSALMWLRSSVPVSCPLTTDSLRQEEAWASAMEDDALHHHAQAFKNVLPALGNEFIVL